MNNKSNTILKFPSSSKILTSSKIHLNNNYQSKNSNQIFEYNDIIEDIDNDDESIFKKKLNFQKNISFHTKLELSSNNLISLPTKETPRESASKTVEISCMSILNEKLKRKIELLQEENNNLLTINNKIEFLNEDQKNNNKKNHKMSKDEIDYKNIEKVNIELISQIEKLKKNLKECNNEKKIFEKMVFELKQENQILKKNKLKNNLDNSVFISGNDQKIHDLQELIIELKSDNLKSNSIIKDITSKNKIINDDLNSSEGNINDNPDILISKIFQDALIELKNMKESILSIVDKDQNNIIINSLAKITKKFSEFLLILSKKSKKTNGNLGFNQIIKENIPDKYKKEYLRENDLNERKDDYFKSANKLKKSNGQIEITKKKNNKENSFGGFTSTKINKKNNKMF